jgi:hypothetical protein
MFAAVTALAVAGCSAQSSTSDSSGKFQGDQRLVANTVEDFESAATKGDQDKICRDLLATALVNQFAKAGGSCEAAVDGALKDADTYGLTVDSVTINGDQATAQVTADRNKKDVKRTLTLVKQGAGWRISEFGSG